MKSKYQIPALAVPVLAIITLAVFGASTASAQSSGNFTATITQAQCMINTVGGLPDSGALSGGSPLSVLDAYIKTPNSTFTTLLIRPSLVTGLFNNTQLTSAMDTSANSAAVKVYVTLDGVPVAPDNATVPYPGNGIIYDERFQQVSSDSLLLLAVCGNTNNCIDLVESTLAAHSFDFVAPNVGGGTHHLQVSWLFVCTDSDGTVVPCSTAYTANTAGACAGPGSVTVTQTKNFKQNSTISIGP
jgi:hypothetical protein